MLRYVRAGRERVRSARAVRALRRHPDARGRALARAFTSVQKSVLDEQERIWIQRIEAQRHEFVASSEVLEYVDYGSGSHRSRGQALADGTVTRLVSEVCEACKPPRWCLLLFKLVEELQPAVCLELGTCLGISAAYQGAALKCNDGGGKLVTLEGGESVAQLARESLARLGLDNVYVHTGRFDQQLERVLRTEESVDFAFIDGHHDEQATLEYFDQILPHLTSRATIVFDDINWSKGMQSAWQAVVNHPRAHVTIDLREIGICFIGDGSSSPDANTIGSSSGSLSGISRAGLMDQQEGASIVGLRLR